MAAKKNANTALQQKVKVLAKLYDSGCKTEKDLRALSLQSILKIPDISVSDMTVITELQEQIAKMWFAGIRMEMRMAKCVRIKI